MIFEGPLGQRKPTDDRHRQKYPMTADAAPEGPVPVVLGINWYSNFDRPEKVGGRYMIGRGDLGRVRGGHAICTKPRDVEDKLGWWRFYDQLVNGPCGGFATGRMLTLMNRERYDGLDLYRRAQHIDEWPGNNYSGTSVRACFDVVRTEGPRQVSYRRSRNPDPADGIASNRWALSVEDVLVALGMSHASTIPLLQSWGESYPHIVHMPVETAYRVLVAEDGEAAIPVDR